LIVLPKGKLRNIAFTRFADLIALAANQCENLSEYFTFDPRRHKLPNDNATCPDRRLLGSDFHVMAPE
jgi:hypothetical protein